MRSPGRPEPSRAVQRAFWRLIAAAVTTEDAAAAVGVSAPVGVRWFRHAGGMSPISLAEPTGRYLSFPEREEIALLKAQDHGVREIARRIGRDPSTISRELRRNAATRAGQRGYRAGVAQWKAQQAAKRPKVAKLAAHPRLRAYVERKLAGEVTDADGRPVPGPNVPWKGRRHGRRADRRWGTAWSPEQISHRLRLDFGDDKSMQVSHETIYQSLFVQGRGALRRELTMCLRTGRALREPRSRTRAKGKKFVTDDVKISARPPEVADRAMPGHWEGDLIIGLDKSAVGTLVERTTRYTMLLHLPRMAGHGETPRVHNGPPLAGHGAEAVRDAIAAKITMLPAQLRASLTWDQGSEMAQHAQLRIDTGLQVYFCDPHSPWQRGTNENTNGLLRQYLPKGTDLARYTEADLDAVAHTLNSRPRKTLAWATPAEALNQLLSHPPVAGVATTP
jgi:IS30 family transposase